MSPYTVQVLVWFGLLAASGILGYYSAAWMFDRLQARRRADAQLSAGFAALRAERVKEAANSYHLNRVLDSEERGHGA